MKKIWIIVAILIVFLSVGENKAIAQNKFGYFDPDYVVSLMPGIGRVDTLLTIYERDSLGRQYQALVKEYRLHDSLMRVGLEFFGLDTAEKAAIFRNTYLLQNWLQYSQHALQAKQKGLIQPFYNQVMTAYQQVIDEGKYTYVFKRDALLYAPQPDNLTITVTKKLGIKVTDEILLQASPAISPTIASPKFRFPVRK